MHSLISSWGKFMTEPLKLEPDFRRYKTKKQIMALLLSIGTTMSAEGSDLATLMSCGESLKALYPKSSIFCLCQTPIYLSNKKLI